MLCKFGGIVKSSKIPPYVWNPALETISFEYLEYLDSENVFS